MADSNPQHIHLRNVTESRKATDCHDVCATRDSRNQLAIDRAIASARHNEAAWIRYMYNRFQMLIFARSER